MSTDVEHYFQLFVQQDERAFYLHDYGRPDDHLAKLLHAFGQKKVVGWKGLPSDLFVNVQKLGEGTYGEVFKTTYRGQQVAVKVTPITNHDGGFMGKVNGEALKDASLVIPEFVITQELSRLAQGTRNKTNTFIGLHEARVVRGCYPGEFLDAWDRFKAVQNTENVRPDQYADKDQLFVTMALDVSGADLDSYKIKSVEEATSILLQTMWALMAAEKELKFEHRDLHAGNVLLQKTDEEHISFRVDDVPHSVRSHGVRVRIIDFTLSRMEKGTTKIFLDPSGIVELFSGRDDYQFDVYRLMRAHNKNNWQTFCPSRICCGFTTYVTCRKRTLKKQRQQLQEVFDRVLQYDSLEHFVSEDTAFIDTVKNGYVIEE